MIAKSEIDYLNYNDLNEIEEQIDKYTKIVQKVTSIPDFKTKHWKVNDMPYIQEIDRIERGITNLGEYYNKPKGWLPTKTWITKDNEYPIKAFDYRDWNRWVNNLTIFDTDVVLTDTIWNGASFINWDEKNVDWR